MKVERYLKMAVFWVVAPCTLVEGKLLQGAKTQKTAIFVLTAVRTSSPTLKDVIFKYDFGKKSYEMFS
jgi:hypothetical protein